jgi:hypothetical protein
MADSDARLEEFRAKLETLVRKAASGEGDFSFPKGEFDGIAAVPFPDQYDFLFTYKSEGAPDNWMIEAHIFPNQNPRALYDETKDSALKPDPWGQVVGWIDSPRGFPNRNDYDDIRMSGQEEKNPHLVRWVQQEEGASGGYFVRLETTSEAPKDHLKHYANALWHIVHEAGYYDPNT